MSSSASGVLLGRRWMSVGGGASAGRENSGVAASTATSSSRYSRVVHATSRCPSHAIDCRAQCGASGSNRTAAVTQGWTEALAEMVLLLCAV